MIHPADEHDPETQQKCEGLRQEVLELVPQVAGAREALRARGLELDDEQREGDRKHAVAKGLESRVGVVGHRRSLAYGGGGRP